MATSSPQPYRMPRSIPAPNVGRLVKPPPAGSPLWRLLDFLSAANIWLYRRSGGRIGGRMGQAPVLLLHHVGPQVGTRARHPGPFMADGERLVVVGSKGGASTHPAWYINLMAAPVTRVEVGRRSVRVRARALEGAERDAYWPRLVKVYPSFAIYQQRTERLLPVVALDPLSGA